MTRKEAKEFLPIIKAFAEGKEIQYKNYLNGWQDINKNDGLSFVMPPTDYRIKPEPKYRSFRNAEECLQEMLKHQPFGWIKREEGYFNIVYVNDKYAGLSDKYNSAILLASVNSYEDNTFIDGTPFGIKE